MPVPARIDWDSSGGPVLRYERITAAEVIALDLLLSIADSWTPGANTVDHGDESFDVFAAFVVIAQADGGFARFMALALQAPEDVDLSE